MAEVHVDGCAARRFDHRPPNAGPIVVMRQSIEPFILASIDAVPSANLPSLSVSGSRQKLERELRRGLAGSGFGPRWLADWLVENMMFQERLYGELTCSDAVRIRLEAIDDDGCRCFHTDDVGHRLVCTFRGPGTEWIDPKVAGKAQTGDSIDPGSIRRLERGAIALMRGGKGATAARPGLLHRSPRIEETGITRLLLAIEADERG